jgi:hypothetical protein
MVAYEIARQVTVGQVEMDDVAGRDRETSP